MRDELDRRGMAFLSGGHTFTDMGQGAIPALLPFLREDRGYSFAALSALVLAATVSSSIVQPLFGAASDRRSLPWLMPGGLALTGIGIGLAGIAPSYALTFAAIALSGLGVAAFHPEASRFANYVSGTRRATGMSLFSVGGNAGFALGPIVVTPLVLALGLPGMLVAGLLPVLMAVVLARELPQLKAFRPSRRATQAAVAPPDQWGAFTRLAAAVGVRSAVYFGLATFVPLYFVTELDASKADANTALTVMLVAGAAGTLIGGRLADRVGRRPVFAVSTLSLTPLILAFLAADRTLAVVLLALIGAMIIATFSVTVVMGQEYLPNRIGVASGVTLGLAIGVGGVAASALGLLADRAGLETAMYVIAFTPLLAAALALSLPRALTAVAAVR
ncbi:MAG: MFS transporter [Solirubrobacterales bacterium]|jgi:FSR family fosmidomycin resistance protein-like MFS transporter|nr:MFS transporter [Solirubrobacterales bacterium]